MPSAYLLVTHGSRDPRPQAAVEQLAQLMSQKLRVEKLNWMQKLRDTSQLTASSVALQPLVGTACLELAPLPLHEQVEKFGKYALAAGFSHLQVLPLFLLPGVHVMEDIPAEVATAKQAFGSNLTVEMRPYLGSHPHLGRLLSSSRNSFAADAWILLSHGSRRQGGNQPVEALATQLGAITAYWSVLPTLESQVKALVMAGNQRIGILPYFLFAGGITDALARSVEEIKKQFPTVNFYLAEPLGASAELADLILDLTR